MPRASSGSSRMARSARSRARWVSTLGFDAHPCPIAKIYHWAPQACAVALSGSSSIDCSSSVPAAVKRRNLNDRLPAPLTAAGPALTGVRSRWHRYARPPRAKAAAQDGLQQRWQADPVESNPFISFSKRSAHITSPSARTSVNRSNTRMRSPSRSTAPSSSRSISLVALVPNARGCKSANGTATMRRLFLRQGLSPVLPFPPRPAP